MICQALSATVCCTAETHAPDPSAPCRWVLELSPPPTVFDLLPTPIGCDTGSTYALRCGVGGGSGSSVPADAAADAAHAGRLTIHHRTYARLGHERYARHNRPLLGPTTDDWTHRADDVDQDEQVTTSCQSRALPEVGSGQAREACLASGRCRAEDGPNRRSAVLRLEISQRLRHGRGIPATRPPRRSKMAHLELFAAKGPATTSYIWRPSKWGPRSRSATALGVVA